MKKIIENSIASVFNAFNTSSEVSYQHFKLSSLSYKKYSHWIIENIGQYSLFGSNETRHIDELYINISLKTDLTRLTYKSDEVLSKLVLKSGNDDHSNISSTTLIEALNEKISMLGNKQHHKYNNIAIVGTAGAGKTTTLRHLALFAAKGGEIRSKQRFPFFIALRELEECNYSIISAMERYLDQFDINYSTKVVKHFIQKGTALILIDGLDEIPEKYQNAVYKEIIKIQALSKKEFSLKNPHLASIICITGRPYSFNREFSGFEVHETLPLDGSAKRDLIRQWFKPVSIERGELLISHYDEQPQSLAIASSPLMLSLICTLFNNNLEIPEEREELLTCCIDGLMGGWDYFRNICRENELSKFTIPKRKIMLTYLAAATYSHKKIIFSEEDSEISDFYSMCVTKLQYESSSSSLLNVLYNDFGILTELAPKKYSFSHLQLQEFLYAKFIIDTRQEIDFLNTSFEKITDWQEILRLVCKMLPDAGEFIKCFLEKVDYKKSINIKVLSTLLIQKPVFDEAQKQDVLYKAMNWIDLLAQEVNCEYKISWHRVLFTYRRELNDQIQETLNAMTELFLLLRECNCSISKFEYKSDGLINDIKSKSYESINSCCIFIPASEQIIAPYSYIE